MLLADYFQSSYLVEELFQRIDKISYPMELNMSRLDMKGLTVLKKCETTHSLGEADVPPVSNITGFLRGAPVLLNAEHTVRQSSGLQQAVHGLPELPHTRP